ncbi:MAG: DNA recombination protein RmuC [Chloroflexota bacterium]
MSETLLYIIAGLLAANLLLLLVVASRLGRVAGQGVESHLASLEKLLDRQERTLRDELGRGREEAQASARSQREELQGGLRQLSASIIGQMAEIGTMQKGQLEAFATQLVQLTALNEQKMAQMRETLDRSMKELREENAQKLEQMRATVDEKLHATLEQRLGESFKLVSERLELVHKGLGEMQTLAAGVGDLKKVLTNVKTRGTWGEMQLGSLLEQLLTPDQYAGNVATKQGSADRVEFAVRLPGGRDSGDRPVWLPIDAKFPQEDYQRLLEAQENADPAAVEAAAQALERRVIAEGKDIHDKYIDPPNTTDFAIMFLPVEGLYAEVLRRPGLAETLQRKFRVNVTGPTTLAALLNSLQMGFRTLAIERRSSEVWSLLGAVKTEFGKFGDVLEKTRKKLQEATNTMDQASVRTRAISRRLRDVQELPAGDAARLLGPTDNEAEPPVDDDGAPDGR